MTLNDIDYDIRRFNSFILRIVLIIILVSIIIFNQNFFSDWIYYASLIIYIALLFLNLFFVKIERKGVVRLVLDLAIINIFLYNKDLNYILNYLPFFLLIYNVQSHSNKNDKLIYFVLGVHLSLLNIDKFSLILTHHLIPIIFYFFIFILSIRKSFLFVNQEIIVLIGDLFIENVNENNSHKILKDVITKINDSKVKIINQVDEIFLFINNSEKLVLIKASKFVINNDITSSLGLNN
ncbi:hypothetical protein DI487_04890 [Flavobacterium sediminis]|uniref:Uncharacterized protein n=1 Tax=Flavobacterium sediminis TaxID=2201181 RepID=A0A2U8QTU5_9FLAO|nr:hypothetical protein [Flavobacterium sediminis]AWM13264.1 hypothetical protein DI487_04890 [Flavobacterium sediminis]